MELVRRFRVPFSPLARCRGDVWNWFDEFFSPATNAPLIPAIDVEETDEAICVHAEIPGVDPQEVDVSIRDNVLTLRGEKHQDETSKTGNYHRVERRWGSFWRELALPADVDASRVEAKVHNGVLTITLPKAEAVKPKRIEIKAEQMPGPEPK